MDPRPTNESKRYLTVTIKSNWIRKEKVNTTLLIFFFYLLHIAVNAQNQAISDSLKAVLQKNKLSDSVRLQIIEQITFHENSLEEGNRYADLLIAEATLLDNDIYVYHGYLQKGYKLNYAGNLEEALKFLFKSIYHAKKAEFEYGEAVAYGAIASIYTSSNNHKNAVLYFKKAITLLRESNNAIALASNILNIGDAYLTHGVYDSALLYFQESGQIFNQLNHQIGQAYTLGNTGMVYANLGENDLAEQNINQAIDILEDMGDFYPVCFYLISMADIFWERGDIKEAMAYAQRSLDLAEQYGLKQQISDANQKLSELYESLGNTDQALQHYKAYIAYRDSVTNLETVQKMADQRTEFEVSQKQNEIDLQNQEITILEREKELQWTYVAIAFILLVLSGVVILYFRQRFYNTELTAKAERKEHEDEIHDLLKGQETQALQMMVQGKEEERRHLARELHNHLGSLLATVKVNLNGLESTNTQKHETIIGLVDQACQDVRNLSHELHMGVSENFGLIPALQELVSHMQQNKNLKATLSADLGAIQINSENEILVYRIIQELVSNVLKHAHATRLAISLTGFEEGNLINILVEDDGIGFDPDSRGSDKNGIGLYSLKDMIHKLDGEVHIESSAATGTLINVDIPFEVPENEIVP